MRSVSPAPKARPTRMLTAIAIPNGIMNVRAAQVMAIWCAANAVAPSQPIKMADAPNAPASKDRLIEMGTPNFNICPNRAIV